MPTLVGVAAPFGVGVGSGGIVSFFPAFAGRAGVSNLYLVAMCPEESVGVPVGLHGCLVGWAWLVLVVGGSGG